MKCTLIIECHLQGERQKVVLPCSSKAEARRIVAENLTYDFQYCPLEKIDHNGTIAQDRQDPMRFRFTGTDVRFSSEKSDEYIHYQITSP